MTRILSTTILLLLAGALAPPTFGGSATVPEPAALHAGAAGTDTVYVAPPTGGENDRASILAALERAGPGTTVQFAPGTYVVGEIIRIETPRITLLGHTEGTVLRGCSPEEYEANERETASSEGRPTREVVARCGAFELTGGDATVRGLTFEFSRLGLLLGCCHTEPRFRLTPGGYTIERNVFRNSLNGIRPWTTEPSVIRENEFVNTFHAISGVGSHLHVLDNEISVPDPSLVPGVGHPSFALALGPLPARAADALGLRENGEGYVISGNRIEGHPDGIFIPVYPGTTFRGNVIRDNSIRVSRVLIPPSGPRPYIVDVTAEADSTIVGIPIGLYARPGFGGAESDDQEDGWFEDNLIEGNRILGAEGVGLALQRGRGNRIVENIITDVVRRDPFRGNTVVSSSELWEAANGSAIWVSPGSDSNEIVGNTFEDVAGAEVFVEGDRNRVELRSPADSVRDLGTDNEVSVADGAEGPVVTAAERVAGAADTVHVAPPTGDRETDRSSVLAALGRGRPGGTVLFAPGTYHVGEIIPLETPRVTLVGHPDGTTLRGCDPTGYEELEREAVRAIASGDPDAAGALHRQCGMFALTGGQVTVRDLTFEYSRLGLLLGCCHADEVLRPSPGGYRIEGNTFRNSGNSIRAILAAAEPTVIRGNRFINTFHALSATASHLHVLDNEISMPEPGRVPGTGHPGFAIGITALPPGHIAADADVCEQNIIAGNRIDGHPDGILLSARQPGASCRENVVRENTIQVRRVRFPVPWLYADLIPLTSPEDSTFVGVPLALSASTAASDSADDQRAPARVENNRVENNRIIGAEGLGIAISHASGNRVANNTVTGIERRDPFPGNRVGWFSTEWNTANGSGIWVSPGSDENEIVGNTFEDIEGAAVFLEGDENRVELQSAADVVRDLGTGNQVSMADGGPGHDPSMGQASLGDSALVDTLLTLTHDLADSWTRLEPDDYLDRFSVDLEFYFEGSRVPRSEFEAVVRGTMEALAESTFEVSDPDVEVLGPNAAVISFGLREVMVDRGGVVTDLRGALTLVWERREGEWRVVRAHESLPPADDWGR